ncbi:hypothetical protein ACIBEJ_34845 [Nonomuraea sp. NPDC050790]|uniref:hypothetical protein n=1 Tax=Nonomuraea sp. NPDC050790 TaxID=3364371 RepID=UPI0037B0157E
MSFESPLGEPSTGTSASKLVPEEAVEAAVNALRTREWAGPGAPWSAHTAHNFAGDCAVCAGDVRAIVGTALEAAAPVLAAQVRREAAEQIAHALGSKAARALHEAKEFSTVEDLAKSLVTRAGALSAAAEIAREIGEARA